MACLTEPARVRGSFTISAALLRKALVKRSNFQSVTYSTADVGRIVDVEAFTVSRWVDKGLLPAFRTPGGHRRIHEADLRAFLLARRLPMPPELAALRPAKIRLLVLDDEQLVLTALGRAFKRWSNTVELVKTRSGIEALLLLAHDKPDAVLIDLCMPELDGIEVMQQIRKIPALDGVKLVAMTGSAPEAVMAAALKAGALACLAKPVNPVDVLRLVAPQAAEVADEVRARSAAG
jgi:excisionase family DNA binding protein